MKNFHWHCSCQMPDLLVFMVRYTNCRPIIYFNRMVLYGRHMIVIHQIWSYCFQTKKTRIHLCLNGNANDKFRGCF